MPALATDRDYRIVDTDIHTDLNATHIRECLPEPWRTRYASRNFGAGHIGYWNPGGVTRADTRLPDGSAIQSTPANLARHFLDVYGIDYGILNAGNLHIALSPEPDYAAAVMSAQNDVIVADWLGADPRLRASMVVSPADPELAAREIRRVGSHPGIVQVLMPSASRTPYGQRFFHPIYNAACEQGLPVAIHPGSEGTGISGPPTAAGYPTSYFEWHTALSGSYQAHLLSLVAEGVFQKFPDLRFVLIEGGVLWLPALLWRLDKNWKALRMTVPWLDRPPSEVVGEHIRLTTQPLEEPPDWRHFHAMLAMFDAGRMLMFSSDFPHWDGDTPDFAAGHLPEHLRHPVMGETAGALYRLPPVAPLAAGPIGNGGAGDGRG